MNKSFFFEQAQQFMAHAVGDASVLGDLSAACRDAQICAHIDTEQSVFVVDGGTRSFRDAIELLLGRLDPYIPDLLLRNIDRHKSVYATPISKEDVSWGSAVLTTYVLRVHYMPFEQLWSLLEPHFVSMRTSHAAHLHLLERIARMEQRLGVDVPVQEY